MFSIERTMPSKSSVYSNVMPEYELYLTEL